MIAKVVNPGHIVPVYNNTEWQLHNQCGCKEFDWAIPVASGESLDIQMPINTGALSGWTWTVFSDTGGYSPNTTNITTKITADSSLAWLILEDYQSLIPAGCNTYYIKLSNSVTREDFYTERFRVITYSSTKKLYKLTFSHSTDIDGILYQTGYEQKAWLEGCVWDTPNIVNNRETLTDGNAVEQPTFQGVQRRAVLKWPYLPDFWQGVLHRLEMHDSVVLTKVETGENIILNGNNPEFTTEDQDVCFRKGVLSWIESTQVITGCETNYTLA